MVAAVEGQVMNATGVGICNECLGEYPENEIGQDGRCRLCASATSMMTDVILVATCAATDEEKAHADYICDGVDDYLTLSEAMVRSAREGKELLCIGDGEIVIDGLIDLPALGVTGLWMEGFVLRTTPPGGIRWSETSYTGTVPPRAQPVEPAPSSADGEQGRVP